MCIWNALARRRHWPRAWPVCGRAAVLVQLGLGGDMTVPMQALTAKEITLRGSFRFHEEFFTAVKLMQSGAITVDHLITHSFPMQRRRPSLHDRQRPQPGDEGAAPVLGLPKPGQTWRAAFTFSPQQAGCPVWAGRAMLCWSAYIAARRRPRRSRLLLHARPNAGC